MTEPLIRNAHIHGVCPADGRPLPPVPVTDPASLPALVAMARRAGERLAALSVRERAELLSHFGDAVLARADRLRDALIDECGKPEQETWLHEIGPTADLAAYWCGEGPGLLADETPRLDPVSYPGKQARIERVARGVVGLVTPWNFPLAIPLRALFPALLAGNAVVWKPSEFTPRVAAIVAEAAQQVYGPNVVCVAQGGGEVGAALVPAGIDAVVFTGSVRTGRKVGHAAAEALIPAGLELGGKDPALVLEDADLERTARGLVWGALVNAGQNCAAIERVYVVRPVAGALIDRVVALVRELRPGVDFGPLVHEGQLAVVASHVDAAKAAGARAIVGGERLDRPGSWYAPTVLVDVAPDALAVVEETFGPILPILVVDDEAAAIAAANASRFGLTASVWTRDLERGERVAKQLRAGVTMVNNHGFTGAIPALPWTGVGESGSGVTNSSHTLDLLTRPRAVIVDGSRAERELWWHPYTDGLTAVGRSLAVLRSAAPLAEKAAAAKDLAKGFVGRWKS